MSACLCGEIDCLYAATDYQWCRTCAEHHRAPNCDDDSGLRATLASAPIQTCPLCLDHQVTHTYAGQGVCRECADPAERLDRFRRNFVADQAVLREVFD